MGRKYVLKAHLFDMNNEEKARAYDEVLNWMCAIYPSLSGADKEDAEHFFPALKESDERIRTEIIDFIQWAEDRGMTRHDYHQAKRPAVWLAYLEKQKEPIKAIEAVDRIDKYIDEHLANAHDMKDSNPDKKYYRGWDDALGKMAGILQDVYSEEKQKESLRDFIDNFPYNDEQEEPHYTKRNAIFDKCVENCDPQVMKEVSDEIDEMLQKEQKPAEQLGGTFTSYDMAKTFTEGQNYVIAHPEKFGLCKSAEWSEFDKGALKDAICAADRLGNDESFKKSNPNLAKAFRVAKDWLKSLPERFTLQPEQEVVDRTVFDRIADILRWCDLPIGCPIEDFKQSESEREHLLHIVQCVAHRYANSCTYCKEYS